MFMKKSVVLGAVALLAGSLVGCSSSDEADESKQAAPSASPTSSWWPSHLPSPTTSSPTTSAPTSERPTQTSVQFNLNLKESTGSHDAEKLAKDVEPVIGEYPPSLLGEFATTICELIEDGTSRESVTAHVVAATDSWSVEGAQFFTGMAMIHFCPEYLDSN